jgi:hypothetical protein
MSGQQFLVFSFWHKVSATYFQLNKNLLALGIYHSEGTQVSSTFLGIPPPKDGAQMLGSPK